MKKTLLAITVLSAFWVNKGFAADEYECWDKDDKIYLGFKVNDDALLSLQVKYASQEFRVRGESLASITTFKDDLEWSVVLQGPDAGSLSLVFNEEQVGVFLTKPNGETIHENIRVKCY